MDHEKDVLRDVWQRYAGEIMACCRIWLRGRHQADIDDAFGRVWLRVVSHMPVGEVLGDPRAWLRRVAYRICMDVHRERQRRPEASVDVEEFDDGPRAADDPEGLALDKELRLVLANAVDQLPERLRQAFVVYLRSPDYREVADRLAITELNARKRVQEARAILRTSLADYRAGRGRPRMRRRRLVVRAAATGTRAMRAVTHVAPDGAESERLVSLGAAPALLTAAAIAELERHVERYPRGAIRRLALARALVQDDATAEAVSHYEALVAEHPRRHDIRAELASLLAATGRADALLALRDRAAGAGAAQDELAYLTGVALAARERTDEAEAALRDARALAPGNVRPAVALASLFLAQGKIGAAIEANDQALQLDGDDVAALAITARVLRLAGRPAEAGPRMQRALALDPEHPSALCHRFVADLRNDVGAVVPPALLQLTATSASAVSAVALRHIATGRPIDGLLEHSLLRRRRPRLRNAVLEHARLLDFLGGPRHALDALATLPSARDRDLLAIGTAVRAANPEAVRELAARLLRDGAWMPMAMAAWALARTPGSGFTAEEIRELADAALALEPELPAARLQHAATVGASPLEELDSVPPAPRLAALHRRFVTTHAPIEEPLV